MRWLTMPDFLSFFSIVSAKLKEIKRFRRFKSSSSSFGMLQIFTAHDKAFSTNPS